ncbi:thiosulfate dehydrogenase [quinone] large subunit [Saccharicrinis carchari]|uniref:Thiosulfate dehydrogenase [quinone] large subunit n=1 Tax=Saccharicrinis carchari TaxID=1168039 RepID=A0A521B1I7_SACCC|nr:DoxX family membrane protein [Saccharicrinis carchari]SMO40937.1 thiosulfate dehydrogenase [quinone] large subunit [Saccharicrinis carchari]
MTKKSDGLLQRPQLLALVVCRVLIGWHFLYEGFVKILNPNWSAKIFLLDSQGWFKSWFIWMANNEMILQSLDFLNQWGLVFIGASLILGLFSRMASIAGAVVLALYYLSHPPLIGVEYMLPSEGSYLIVNKNLIEMAMLIVLALIPTSQRIGLDRLICNSRKK